MAKTQKELAFLRDLYIQDEWTRRFTDLVDKHLDLKGSDNLLYMNSGTGGHALALDEKYGEKTDIFARAENEDLLTISRDKGAAIKSNVDFSMIRFEDDAFDTVLADATIVRREEMEDLFENTVRTARPGGDVAVFLPANGSFGEIFSLLWEVMFNENIGENGTVAEQLVSDVPTLSKVEEIAKNAGLADVQIETANEVFEYENGEAFIASPLVADFLFPLWLETIEENDRGRLVRKLAELIDVEDGTLSFRFSVKATLVMGKKQK